MAEQPFLSCVEPRGDTANANIGFVWQLISARAEITVCLVCFSLPGSIIKKLLSSWRLLFTLCEICDKEGINQVPPEGVSAKTNTKRQQSTKEAVHPGPRTVALGG